MRLDQFDKLSDLVERAIITINRLRNENHKLKEENRALKEQLQKIDRGDTEVINGELATLRSENEKYIRRQKAIEHRLTSLLKNLEKLSQNQIGVDS